MSRHLMSDKKIDAALALRKEYFESYLKKTIKAPSRVNTHGLSTSMKRILVVNKLLLDTCSKKLLSDKQLKSIKAFRQCLSSIRDNYELLSKLDKLGLDNEFLLLVRRKLLDEQLSLEQSIQDKSRKLHKDSIIGCLCKKQRRKYLKPLSAINITDILSKQLADTEKYVDRAVSHSDDEALHRLRVELKTFRYTYEFFSFVFPYAAAADNIDFLHEFQTVLGEAHDWYVLVQAVANIPEEPEISDKEVLLICLKDKLQQYNCRARIYLETGIPQLKKLISV